MAKFETAGLEEVAEQFMLRGETALKAVPLMIQAGAEVLIRAQQTEAAKLNISGRSKGALFRGIKATKPKTTPTGMSTEVYPQGKDRNHTKAGVDNNEKAFVLEYGRSNMRGRHWMAAAFEKSEDAIQAEMLKVWEGMTNGGG